jgi:hypothetical protein
MIVMPLYRHANQRQAVFAITPGCTKQAGKALNMVHEMRTYQIKVGSLPQYLKQFEEKGLPVVSRYCKLVGYWSVDSGLLNRVVHVWEFASLEARAQARALWWADPDWTEGYLPLALSLVESQESTLMTAAPFSPIR